MIIRTGTAFKDHSCQYCKGKERRSRSRAGELITPVIIVGARDVSSALDRRWAEGLRPTSLTG